ncbi:MAG: TIGR02300 family protein [Alphaproteobacteria bacterium]|nr:TIGR02300 family protein [Alphaproteobacteria bacterium]
MAKPEWGQKRRCQSCAAKYYDLGKSKIECPKCGVEWQPDVIVRSARDAAKAAPPVAKPKPQPALETAKMEEAATDEEIAEGDEEEVLEDASDLGEDEDVAEVIDKPIDGEKEKDAD